MQKIFIFILIVILFSTSSLYSQPKGDIYLHMLTTGQPVATYNLGDKFTSTWYVNFEIGQSSWNAADVGIGQSNTDPNLLAWATANWYADNGSNKQVRTDLSSFNATQFQFTATGTWYFLGRAKADSGDPWHYANNATWANSSSFAPEYYFTVNALSAPTSQSATAASISQIDLNWTRNGTYQTVIVVVRKGDAPNDLSQGTSYTQGSGDINTADGYILYKGTGDYSSADFNHTGLNNNTVYYYKFFTVNNDYYSPYASANATTQTLYTTAQNGDWNTASTWTCNCIPPAGVVTQINHAVTINATATNNPATIEVTSGNSLTFGASGDITATTLTNDGTVDMTSGGLLTFANNAIFTNNATFTAGTGNVVFSGIGTVTGATTFNNIEVKGAVNLGATASLNGTLTINGGYLNNNSITYNGNSTLKYAAIYDINSGDKSWYSNAASSGSAQVGIPWNVEIPTGILVQLNDSYPFSINGSILINGSFRLGTDGTTHWGNFLLRGNFTNNGTFTPNNREVTFNGTSPQTLTGATTFDFFQINGSGGLALNNAITVNKTLTFTNGKITLGNNNITLDATAGSISGGSSSSYAITNGTGYLIQNVGGTEKTFPVGTSTSYAPAYLTQAGTAENLYVRVKQGFDNATNNNDFAVNLQWTLDEQTAGSNSITTKFQWNATDENLYFDRNGQLKIGRYISSAYSSTNANFAGSNPYSASASGMADDISAEIPFVVGNTIAFAANGYRTAQNGNWAVGTTWVGGVVPPVDAVCAILHHVTVNSALNNATEVNIYSGKSVTFQAGGSLTVNGTFSNSGMLKTDAATASVTINGTLRNSTGASLNMVNGGTISFQAGSTFANTGTFTSGIGTIDFQGAGTASGTLSFYNLNVAGTVDLGNAASLNNILTLSGTGDLTTNSIIYSEGSILKFDRDYSLGDNKVWYRNTGATGTAQVGIPWNVQIVTGRSVSISDNLYRAINGNLTIDGTFALSSSSGGDFKIKGDFTNNGTFTHNTCQVTFYGSANQKIKGTGVSDFAYLTINNNSNVTLEKDCNVINTLDFTAGKLILGNFNLAISTGGSLSNYTSSKYIVTNGTGYLIQNVGTSETTFPIGTMTNYNPAYLTETTAEIYSLRVQNSIDNTVNDPTQIVNVQWTIDNGAVNADNVTVKLQWNSSDQASGFVAGTDDIAYYSGSYNNANATTSGLTASRTVASSVANSPTPFIVAEAAAFSGGIYTVATGDWNVGTTWNGGVAPGTGNCAIIKNTHTVTLTSNPSVKAISIENGGTLNCVGQTITLDNGGAISNSGTFTAGTGKVVFSGAGSISTGSITFNNVDINGPVSFGSNSTIAGILSINSGGSVNVNPPKYATTSTLKYNQGGSVSRSSEWQYNLTVGDPGYPANVQISNSTILDVDADANDDNYYQTRFLNGNLTIELGSEITLNNMGGGISENQICGLYAKGNITNAGTITLSTEAGGDMMLEGDITNTGTINWNSRAVFFTGDNNVNQNITGISQIPFILISRGANVILNNNLEVNGSGAEFITFARPTSTNTGSIDLNNHNLTCAGTGNIELNDISGAEVTGTGRVEITGGNCSYSGTNGGTLAFGPNVTLAINGGTMTFPSSLGIVTVNGTLEVGDGATITNIPTYGDNSTLHYVKGGNYTMGAEWTSGSNVADNIPYNVTVSQGSTSSVLNMNAARYAIGTLLIQNNATLETAAGTGQLTVNNLTVESGGKIVLKSPANNGAAGSFISTGTVTNSGTMQAERYTSAGQWTYLSPTNTLTSSTLFTTHSGGYFNPNLYYYSEDFAAPADPAGGTYAQWFNTSNNFKNAWIPAHDGSSGTGLILGTAARGYAFFNDESKMCVFDGQFTNGNQNISVYYHDNDGNSGYFDGWNLIANPFPSALDWNNAAWDKTYINNTLYFYDGTIGNYKYYNGTGTPTGVAGDDETYSVNGGTAFIPASQAFFVKAKISAGTSGQSFTIPNNARVHSTQSFWKKSSGKSSPIDFIKLSATANNNTDETLIRSILGTTELFDGDYDAYKMYSSASNVPQIYSYTSAGGAGFAINSLDISADNISIPLGIEIRKRSESLCSIDAEKISMPEKHVYLEDISKSVYQNLRTNPHYQFTIADSSDIRDRFVLHFTQNQAPTASEIANQNAYYSELFEFTLPENTFIDTNDGDILTYQSSLSDNNSLPIWLQFNPETKTFTGTPNAVSVFSIKITAVDLLGLSVSQNFLLTVNPVLANIVTQNVSQISQNSALFDGEILSEGGAEISQTGFCYATHENPDINDFVTSEIPSMSHIQSFAENLEPNTEYFVRAYATNDAGTNYGNSLSFSTLTSGVPTIDSDLSIYPNPSAGTVYIKLKNKNQIRVSLTDISGIVKYFKISAKTAEHFVLDLTDIPAGIYSLKIEDTENLLVTKLIINK